MIVSMTGFAAATRESDDLAVNVTLRSVNHRHLDVQFRLPQSVQGLETAFRAAIQQRLARGRVEVAMSVQERTEPRDGGRDRRGAGAGRRRRGREGA